MITSRVKAVRTTELYGDLYGSSVLVPNGSRLFQHVSIVLRVELCGRDSGTL